MKRMVSVLFVSTTLLSTTLTTPAYAMDAYKVDGGANTKVVSILATNSSKFSNYLEEAKTQTEQLQSLIDSGTIDANILKSIYSSLRNANHIFESDEPLEISSEDDNNLNYIWNIYRDIDLNSLIKIGSSDDTVFSDTLRNSKNLLARMLDTDVLAPTSPTSNPDTNLYGSLDNFKRTDTSISFSDINSSQWFYDEVMEASQLGLFKGNDDGTFNPEGHLTYAEAVALAARVHATYYDNKWELDDFNNRPTTNHWADNTISYADKYGITSTVKGITTLDAPCTRQQMADLFVSAIVPYEVNPDSMFISGVFTQINDMSKAPEQTNSPSIQILFKAGILIGDSNGFRPTSSITRAETACILNRVATPSKRKKVTTPKTSITSPSKPSTSTKFSTDIPKDPATGKFIPTNDTTMVAYNRPELVNFIYTTMQDKWYDGYKNNYQGLYNTGSDMMVDVFGGYMQLDENRNEDYYINGAPRLYGYVSRETYKGMTEEERRGTNNVPRGTVEDIQAGDFITIPNWVNAKMLVVERKQDSVIVIEPTESSNATFRWREYTFDQLEVKLGDNCSTLYHLEFKGL